MGNRVRAKVVKNKVAAPFRTAEFDIMFDGGISREGDVLDLALAAGLVKKMGAFFSYGETKLGHGRENTKDFLKQHTEIVGELEQKIRDSSAAGTNVHREDEEAVVA